MKIQFILIIIFVALFGLSMLSYLGLFGIKNKIFNISSLILMGISGIGFFVAMGGTIESFENNEEHLEY